MMRRQLDMTVNNIHVTYSEKRTGIDKSLGNKHMIIQIRARNTCNPIKKHDKKKA